MINPGVPVMERAASGNIQLIQIKEEFQFLVSWLVALEIRHPFELENSFQESFAPLWFEVEPPLSALFRRIEPLRRAVFPFLQHLVRQGQSLIEACQGILVDAFELVFHKVLILNSVSLGNKPGLFDLA